ncbi:MAG: HPr family phosphocarrier protein [Pseudobutyrivibrio sp.]|nr:HPr family phosphocarrier protein [Pseudobutyrivibrio sp.]
MKILEYKVNEKEGLHALPATEIIRKLNTLKCDITASFNGSMVNAKSPFGLIALGAKYGDVINLIAEGDDEEKLFELNL